MFLKPFKDMSMSELVDHCAGTAITNIGAGDRFRAVILLLVHNVIAWTEERNKAENPKVDRQPSDQVIKAKIVNTTVDAAHPQVYTILHGTDFDPNVELVYREGKLIDVKLIKA